MHFSQSAGGIVSKSKPVLRVLKFNQIVPRNLS